ncbi:paired amphipathic helix protein Sin3a [Platysternon megacephalum]|uniref:Adenosine receptor A3 n=1 Tax=Platysternon megacephalum TaxID=55544 RepID=A0A4D9EA99_9SAUR|nr:paired amphipathic helix protein Sin3a [Platysternon megacephalum]
MTNSSLTLSSLDAVYITIESMIGISATVGNILVIWVVKLNPAFQTNTFYFIVSLALADIAMGILVMPLAIVVSLGVVIHFYSCLFMCCLLVVFSNASILSLLAIAIDRYLRVKLPTRYRIITTKRRIWVALGICWLLSLLTGFVPMFGWNQRIDTKRPSELKCQFPSVMRMDYMVYFNFFAWILIPLILMCALYIEIFYIIRTKLSQSATNTNAGVFYGKEFKAAKSLALVLFLFAICWLPLSILNCISYFCPNCLIPQHLWYVSILLSHSNSVMNPIVYACKIKKFKDTYTLILRTYVLCMSPKPVSPSMEQTSECDPVTP